MSIVDDLRAANERLCKIKQNLEKLEKARVTLAHVNNYVKTGQVWNPELCVFRDERGHYYGRPDVTIRVAIPAGVIQQAAINEVVRVTRELNLLGYDWPKP